MSGGYFDYKQHHIQDIINDIETLLYNNCSEEGDSYGDKIYDCYSDKTLAKFVDALKALKIAYIYAQRIDWLESGDDSEETFHTRLRDDLINAQQVEDQ